MPDKNYSNCLYSLEEELALEKLEKIYSAIDKLIQDKRQNILKCLKEGSASYHERRLNEYFTFRLNLEDYVVTLDDNIEYSLDDMMKIAEGLLDDYKNDIPLVLNSLSFFEDSFTREDIILAIHNYRLSKDKSSLSSLVTTIGIIVKHMLQGSGLEPNYKIPKVEMPYDKAISLFKKIISDYDSYIKECKSFFDNGYGVKYSLSCEEKRTMFSDHIDYLAGKSMAEKTDLDEHVEYLMANFKSKKLFENTILKDRLEYLIQILYNTSEEQPSYLSLLELAKKELSINPNDKSLQKLLGIIEQMPYYSDDVFFDENNTITEEDKKNTINHMKAINARAHFDNYSRYIWSMFSVFIAIDEIQELSSDKNAQKERKNIVRKLSSIFDSDYAFETLSEIKDEYGKIKDIEYDYIQKKEKCLTLVLSQLANEPIEKIMSKRLTMLDECKVLCSEDKNFIEECSNKILDKLITKVPPDCLEKKKRSLRLFLESEGVLDDDIIKTLASAEYLYETYATRSFAETGFDYSSISALYFQAFENAYNTLIWKRYSEMLNGLIINSKKYTLIIQEAWDVGKLLKKDDGYGYLPSLKKDWKHYIIYEKNNKTTSIKPSCTYGEFSSFMNNIDELPGFSEWLSRILEFNNREQMLSCDLFMSLLKDFISDIEKATENRNNASHGGSEINLEQCKYDREKILSDLNEIHKAYPGLIQKLVSLFRFCRK